MRIVVLTKPVPDPAAGGERLGPDDRLVRDGLPSVINGNDEYALEAALKLADAGFADVAAVTRALTAALRRRGVRVAEKAGFRLEGRALRYLKINGTWEDHDVYALTTEDWDAMGRS